MAGYSIRISWMVIVGHTVFYNNDDKKFHYYIYKYIYILVIYLSTTLSQSHILLNLTDFPFHLVFHRNVASCALLYVVLTSYLELALHKFV